MKSPWVIEWKSIWKKSIDFYFSLETWIHTRSYILESFLFQSCYELDSTSENGLTFVQIILPLYLNISMKKNEMQCGF